MKSPFKLLDAYTLKDRDVFFGRTDEIATLYDLVNKNRLVLVYGESGTGKTSLVQCGLASYFDTTDWYPIFIRRREDINNSLKQALVKATEENEGESLVEMVENIYTNYLRPVYLIFDQLEELLISGGANERLQFINSINSIYKANLPCRILFILRKEYLANLYDFEKIIPSLFDRRLMVESMSYTKVEEVIIKSCNQFNIKLEQPEVNTRQIIDNISLGKSGIPLTYLQVYLDMIYREDFDRTYPLEPDNPLPLLEFSTAEIESFGKIDNVLKKFLQEQESAFYQELHEKFPDIPGNIVQQILDSFVTEEGTKRAVFYKIDKEIIILDINAPELLLKLPAPVLTYSLQQLEKRRILHIAEQSCELAHDSLAALIDQRRGAEQRQLNEIKNRIKNGVLEYQRSGLFFTDKQILSIEEYLPKLELFPEQQRFIEYSREYVREQKNKLFEEERKKRRRATTFAVIGFVLAGIASIASIWAFQSQKEVEQLLEKVDKERITAQEERDNAEELNRKLQEKNMELQKEEAEKVLQYVDGTIIKSANEMKRKGYLIEYKGLITEAIKELNKYPNNTILMKRKLEIESQ